MEWTYLIQLKPRKLYGRKEAQMRAVNSKYGNQAQSSVVLKTERNMGLSSGDILGQCCEPMILQQRSCSNSQQGREPQANVHPFTERGERLNLSYQRIDSLVKYFSSFGRGKVLLCRQPEQSYSRNLFQKDQMMKQRHRSGYNHRLQDHTGSIAIDPVLSTQVIFLCLFPICDRMISTPS